jgi:hypothetical protein
MLRQMRTDGPHGYCSCHIPVKLVLGICSKDMCGTLRNMWQICMMQHSNMWHIYHAHMPQHLAMWQIALAIHYYIGLVTAYPGG